VWLEQEDASIISQGEEVTLMDWGNAVIEVRHRKLTCLKGRIRVTACAPSYLHI
jgi:hypothetical protein